MRRLAGQLGVARRLPSRRLAIWQGRPATVDRPGQFSVRTGLPASGSWPALAGSYRGSGYRPASLPWPVIFPSWGRLAPPPGLASQPPRAGTKLTGSG